MSRLLPGLDRLNTSVATTTAGKLLPAVMRFDAVDGGSKTISGTVYLKGPPQVTASRRVVLLDRLSMRAVREVWSRASDGYYAFTNIRSGTYVVVSFDHLGNYNAVIKDRITA